jgi:hypothetical protein
MKNILVLLLCCLSFSTFAQVNTDKTPPAPQPPGGYPFLVERKGEMTVAEYKERIFGALDLNQVPTGRLMEYTLVGWDTTRFTRSSPNDSVLNYGHWLTCYGQLKAAEVNTQSNLLHPDELVQIAKKLAISVDTVPFMVLDKPYNYVRPSSYAEGCFTIDPDEIRLYDVAGRATNPYNRQRLFAVSAYLSEFTAGKNYHFFFPTTL